jgi:hypothetical protein
VPLAGKRDRGLGSTPSGEEQTPIIEKLNKSTNGQKVVIVDSSMIAITPFLFYYEAFPFVAFSIIWQSHLGGIIKFQIALQTAELFAIF